MKNSQVNALTQVLATLSSNTSPKLVFFVAMNLRRLTPVMESLDEARRPTKDYLQYEQLREELCLGCADRDSNNIPVTQPVTLPGGRAVSAYVIREQRGSFEEALKELDAKFASVRQVRMKQEAEVFALMQEKVDVDLVSIRMSECPEGVLTGDVAAVLMQADLLEWDAEKPGDVAEV